MEPGAAESGQRQPIPLMVVRPGSCPTILELFIPLPHGLSCGFLAPPPSPPSTLCTCSSLSVYSHFQASSSSSWQLVCLHLPNNIRILPLKKQEVTNLLLARINACHRHVPRSQASCSLLYLGGDGPFPPICSVFCFSEVLKSLRKHLARNETEVWLSNVCLWACGYPGACSTLGYRFVQVP